MSTARIKIIQLMLRRICDEPKVGHWIEPDVIGALHCELFKSKPEEVAVNPFSRCAQMTAPV